MASLYDASATKALNEDEYINKLYDSALESQKNALQQGYEKSAQQIATGQQNTKNQTSDYLNRAYVEGQRASGHLQKPNQYVSDPGISSGETRAQERLTMGNQHQKNVSVLNNQQAVAEQEYERQRKLLADKYEAQIKQAQADNDMVRAQYLYNAAKAEEEQLRSIRDSAASLMAGNGDMSIVNAIAQGSSVTPDTAYPTWDGVLRNEADINRIYDAKLESQKQEAGIAHMENASALDAQQQAAAREMDKDLTDAYVDALKRNQNYQEVQNAYGQGSGASIRARLAREAGLTEKLTNLRKLQMNADTETELKKAGLTSALGETLSKAQGEIDMERNKALYDAAENEERKLIEDQKTAGSILAKQNDYSVLGKLYGLTQDQIDRLQGTGAYAPVYNGGVGGSGSSGGGGGGGPIEPDRSDYRVVNMSNNSGVRVDNGGMSWAQLAAAVQEGTVIEVFDDKNKTVHYVRASQVGSNRPAGNKGGKRSEGKAGGNSGVGAIYG